MKEQHLLALTECLYATSLDPSRWSNFAPVLARAFGGISAVVQVQNRPRKLVSRLSTTANYTPEINEAYRAYYHQYDLWVGRMVATPRLVATLGEDVVPDDVFFKSKHYNEFCKQVGIARVLGSVFPVARDVIGVVGIHRPPGVARFELPDRRLMDLFLPHLQRALQIHEKLSAVDLADRAALEAIRALDAGVIVVNAECRIIFLNDVAEALFRTGDGAAIVRAELRPRAAQQRAQLKAMVAAAAAAGAGKGLGAGGVLTLPRADRQPLTLLVCPLPIGEPGFGPAQPMALIFVTDPDRVPITRDEMLRQLYGLTKAEALLLAGLLNGERLRDYAGRNAVTMNTVRTQLAHIFTKTGHRRQTELVRACLSNPVVRMAAGLGRP